MQKIIFVKYILDLHGNKMKRNNKSIEALTLDSETDLEGHVPDLADWVGQVVVFLQEVEGAEREKLEGNTHVTVVVEPVEHLHTQTER